MIFVFYLLAGLLIWLSYKSLRGGFEYLNYFKRELAKRPSDHAPFATIIAPCKGLDEGFEDNLAALFDQYYPAYEILFVLDASDDPARRTIEKLIAARTPRKPNDHGGNETQMSYIRDESSFRARIVYASKAVDSSQKVENLREAILQTDERSQVFVLVDSDARPARDWLRNLVAPLEDTNIGASTGYRWFISKTPTFASELRNIWNASIASVLGQNTKENFCWAGSMAIRRDVFEKLDIRKKWRGTLSDDFTVTRAMNDAEMPIVFVPQALTASIEDCTFREMLEFTTRQMKITRVYAPKLWIMSFLGSGLFCLVMIAALLIVILSNRNGIEVVAAIVTIVLVTSSGVTKSLLRLKAVQLVLSEFDEELRKQLFPQLTLWLLSPFVFFYNSVAAMFSRRMVWRGTTYELVSPTQTRVLNFKDSQ